MAPGGALDGPRHRHPLTIQDKTFVPSAERMAQLDPTWDATKWGGEGNLWQPHVYMPAQNPGDPSGMSSVRSLVLRPVVLAAGQGRQVPADGEPLLRPDLRPGRRRVLRAGARPLDAEQLGRHGGLPRHARRQRHGIPDHDDGPEDLPLPHPQRLGRPGLEPLLVRRRPRHRHRGGPQGQRGPGRPDRPERLPDPGHDQEPEGPGLDPDRQRGRLPADPGGRAGPRDHLDHRPHPVRRGQRRPALAAPRAGRTGRRRGRLLGLPGQDAHPLQRRSGRLPGPDLDLRLLRGRTGPEAGRRAVHPAGLRPGHPDGHAGQGVQRRPGAGLRPAQHHG